MQNSWVDGTTAQSNANEEWGEFVQNPSTSSADVQTNEIVTNCQNNICTADFHNPDREKDTEGLCFLSKCYIY